MLTKNDLSQIKTAVKETIRPEIEMLKQSTKKDMKNLEKGLRVEFKDEMKGLETRLKGDMKNMATKNDLKNLQVKLLEKIDEAQMEIIATVDRHKADRETVGTLEERVDRLEDNAGLPPYSGQ